MVTYAEVELLGIGSDGDGGTVMVLSTVQEGHGRRAVPVWIGEQEARAIDRAVRGERLAHALLVDVVRCLGRDVDRVELDTAPDGFSAVFVLDDGTRLPGRPCDAVPVALSAGRPIRIATAVLDRTAIPLEDARTDVPAEATGDARRDATGDANATQVSDAEIDAAAAAMRRWLDSDAARDLTDP